MRLVASRFIRFGSSIGSQSPLIFSTKSIDPGNRTHNFGGCPSRVTLSCPTSSTTGLSIRINPVGVGHFESGKNQYHPGRCGISHLDNNCYRDAICFATMRLVASRFIRFGSSIGSQSPLIFSTKSIDPGNRTHNFGGCPSRVTLSCPTSSTTGLSIRINPVGVGHFESGKNQYHPGRCGISHLDNNCMIPIAERITRSS